MSTGDRLMHYLELRLNDINDLIERCEVRREEIVDIIDFLKRERDNKPTFGMPGGEVGADTFGRGSAPDGTTIVDGGPRGTAGTTSWRYVSTTDPVASGGSGGNAQPTQPRRGSGDPELER